MVFYQLAMTVCAPLGLIWIIVLPIFRWSHGGRVISGDFITDEKQWNPVGRDARPDDGLYMPISGSFLNIWTIILLAIAALGCLVSCFNILKDGHNPLG